MKLQCPRTKPNQRIIRHLVPIPKAIPDTDNRALIGPAVYSTLVLNARSLAKKDALDHLGTDLHGYNVDIAIISETHLKTHHQEEVCKIEGFQTFRRDRKGRKGGGVAVYLREPIQAEPWITRGMPEDIELLWIKILSPTNPAYIGALYHPPRPKYLTSSLLDWLGRSVEEITHEDDKAMILLGGDFNSLDIAEITELSGLFQPSRNPLVELTP